MPFYLLLQVLETWTVEKSQRVIVAHYGRRLEIIQGHGTSLNDRFIQNNTSGSKEYLNFLTQSSNVSMFMLGGALLPLKKSSKNYRRGQSIIQRKQTRKGPCEDRETPRSIEITFQNKNFLLIVNLGGDNWAPSFG